MEPASGCGHHLLGAPHSIQHSPSSRPAPPLIVPHLVTSSAQAPPLEITLRPKLRPSSSRRVPNTLLGKVPSTPSRSHARPVAPRPKPRPTTSLAVPDTWTHPNTPFPTHPPSGTPRATSLVARSEGAARPLASAAQGGKGG